MAEIEAKPVAPPVSEAWRKTEVARDPQRLHPMNFIDALFTDQSEIHGDRSFGNDAAMYAAMARFGEDEVLVLCNRKGRTTKERMQFRFGSPEPEGYRKALRAMKIAEKFGRPVFSFLDLAGAYPGLGAEERGQGEAIARNLIEMSRLRVPTITTITGEGGSGGALALAVADRVLMMENSIYSVISPEGCASIMWKDAAKRQAAADALKYTAPDVSRMGCVDDVIAEPPGGAQADPDRALQHVRGCLQHHFGELKSKSIEELLESRYQKFRNIAQFYTTAKSTV
ncbi:acetyl-CoA carboxylase carboxyltransferase subunit alpha [Terriglobus roseus]|uniref:Acetyl-coenzyme A carboxylase carboxyl transferase subunit alpha n=1 Tax=Terriglobus roseus TaxID=392734 RepID=A0A1H4IUZ7_9BACT|nr:acetyl-CoA carboxylase carboxyltransferase subunit alpha [Terriglobus roseus]SEB37879.1 acetyl-CoA carboxylase carboxyl transferase subunit alpha [Terriglobus roseus]